MINVIGCTENGEIIAQVKQREYRIRPGDFAGWVSGFTVGYDTAIDDNDEAAPAPAAPAPAAPAPAAPAPAAPAPAALTVEDVRKAFKDLEANGVTRAAITAAIKKYGKTLPEVPADKLQELLDDVRHVSR